MSSEEELKDIKPGDAVAYWAAHARIPQIRVVDRITPSGWFVVGNSYFNKDGSGRGGSWRYGFTRITPLTPELRDKARHYELAQKLSYVRWHELTLEQLEAAEKAIGKEPKLP